MHIFNPRNDVTTQVRRDHTRWGLGGDLGVLKAGAEADIVMLRTDQLGLAPSPGDDANELAIVVNSGGTRDVDRVISDGNVVVYGGRLLGQNEAQLSDALIRPAQEAIRRTREGFDWQAAYGADAHLQTYGSVRTFDRLEVGADNRSDEPKCALVAFSGLPFGGTAPAMLDARGLQCLRWLNRPIRNTPSGFSRYCRAHG